MISHQLTIIQLRLYSIKLKEDGILTPIKAIRGMNDILPIQSPYWQYLKEVLQHTADSYGYGEIYTPVLEYTSLFQRTIGEATDIIEKEMYTFDDRNKESLSMRPEGTAGCVRAGIQHGLFHNQIQRLWYMGPMFRYERPQLGRFRQFYQFGVEAFGMDGPDIDAEQLLMANRIWQNLGLHEHIVLQINSLGTSIAREKYREELIKYFNENYDMLDEDSIRRLQSNPLRILDSKNPSMQLLIANAPKITEFLDAESRGHFDQLRRFLDAAKINYEINSRIVRGLDYYSMTVYEWVTDRLGAQGTVCAGGRYDSLVECLGGKPTPAVGFAIGLERVVTLLEAIYKPNFNPDVYFIMVGLEATIQATLLAEQLRSAFPELIIVCDYTQGNFKNQFRRADKSGAKIALIIGEDEVKQNTVSFKHLREEKPQQMLKREELQQWLLPALVE